MAVDTCEKKTEEKLTFIYKDFFAAAKRRRGGLSAALSGDKKTAQKNLPRLFLVCDPAEKGSSMSALLRNEFLKRGRRNQREYLCTYTSFGR